MIYNTTIALGSRVLSVRSEVGPFRRSLSLLILVLSKHRFSMLQDMGCDTSSPDSIRCPCEDGVVADGGSQAITCGILAAAVNIPRDLTYSTVELVLQIQLAYRIRTSEGGYKTQMTTGGLCYNTPERMLTGSPLKVPLSPSQTLMYRSLLDSTLVSLHKLPPVHYIAELRSLRLVSFVFCQ
jgi:hypothetical protein